MPWFTEEQLENLFTYHAPKEDQAERYQDIRDTGRFLAETIQKHAPDSAEKTLAIRKVQEAVMWANAAIACNE